MRGAASSALLFHGVGLGRRPVLRGSSRSGPASRTPFGRRLRRPPSAVLDTGPNREKNLAGYRGGGPGVATAHSPRHVTAPRLHQTWCPRERKYLPHANPTTGRGASAANENSFTHQTSRGERALGGKKIPSTGLSNPYPTRTPAPNPCRRPSFTPDAAENTLPERVGGKHQPQNTAPNREGRPTPAESTPAAQRQTRAPAPRS
jgi:hypothetical protein